MGTAEQERFSFESTIQRADGGGDIEAQLILEGGAGLVRPVSKARLAWRYLSRATLHPYNLIALTGAMLLALVNWSGWVLLVGFALEVVFLAALPWFRPFRRRVDAAFEAAERAALAKAREALIARMGEIHRQQLAKIDTLIDRTREALRGRGVSDAPALDDCVGLSRLTARYIRLAIAHRACEESLSTTNYDAVRGTIRALEALERTPAITERMRALCRRRLGIAYKREECWHRTRENLDAIAQQLATIFELVSLLHERSVMPLDPHRASVEVDEFVRDLEDTEAAATELGDLGLEDDFVMRDLEIERAALAPPLFIHQR
jgi:hypothetical protein